MQGTDKLTIKGMKITFSLIESWSVGKGFIVLNAHQLRLLGVGHPPKKGWIQRLIGKEIPDSTAAMIAEMKGVKKKERNSILTDSGISPRKLFQQTLIKLNDRNE